MKRTRERAGLRHARLQTILSEEARTILRDDVTDPRLEQVWITSLALSSDGSHVRIHVASGADPAQANRADILTALQRLAAFVRYRFATDIDLKRVPEVHFLFDGWATESPEEQP